MKKVLFFTVLTFAAHTAFADNTNRLNIKYGANGGGFGLGPSIDVRIGNKFTIGAVYESISLSEDDVEASSKGYGPSIRYYFNEALTRDSYLSLTYITGSAEASDTLSSVDVDANSLALTFGRTWMYNHFNFDAAIGVRSISLDEINASPNLDTSSIEDLEGTDASISFTVGLAF